MAALVSRANITFGPGRLGTIEHGAPGSEDLTRDSRQDLLTFLARCPQRGDTLANSRHAQGLALAFLGRLELAADVLHEAAVLDPTDHRLWTDRASVSLALARSSAPSRILDVFQALNRASELGGSRHPAYLFDRCLALDTAGMSAAAERCWLGMPTEPGSLWSDRASARARHLHRLREGMEQWPGHHRALLTTTLPARKLRDLVRQYPREIRELHESEVLGAWGDALHDGDLAEADRLLAQILDVARLMDGGSDGLLLLDVAKALEDSGPSSRVALAAGHRAFRDGVRLYRAHRPSEALDAFKFATRRFGETASPFVHWSRFFIGACSYHQGDFSGARGHVDRVSRGLPAEGWPELRARVLWADGLLRRVDGELTRAIASFEAARREYDRLRERDRAGYMEALVAEDLEYLGREREAWEARRRAWGLLPHFTSPESRYLLWYGMAQDARRRGESQVADLLFRQMLLVSRQGEDDLRLAFTFAGWAPVLNDLGQDAEAASALREARTIGADLDPAVAKRLEAHTSASEALILAKTTPDRALPALDRAIEEFGEAWYFLDPVDLYLARSHAESRTGDAEQAEVDLRRAVNAAEAQRERLDTGWHRSSYFDRGARAHDALVASLLDQGREAEALVVADASRARVLREDLETPDGGRSLDLPRLREALRPEETLIVFHDLPEELVAWSVTCSDLAVSRIPIHRDELVALGARWIDELQSSTEGAAADRASEVLTGPLLDGLESGQLLLVVPPTSLPYLPIAALRLPNHEALLEKHDTVLVPSVSTLLVMRRRAATSRSNRHLVLVAAPATSIADGLPTLSASVGRTQEVAALYDQAAVALGDDASVEFLRRHAADADVLEVAAHTRDERDAPQMVLADGVLDADELSRWSLPRRPVIVLAGCGTATGSTGAREGSAPLIRPLLIAGAGAVVSTLWPVEDVAAAELGLHVHRELAAGANPATALRHAQRSMLRHADPSFRRPAVWAAFTITGTS